MELSFRTIISLVHLIHLFIMRQWVNLSVFRHSWLRRGLFHRHHSYMHCCFESCPTQSLTYCLYCCRLPSQWRSDLRCFLDRSAQQVDRSCGHWEQIPRYTAPNQCQLAQYCHRGSLHRDFERIPNRLLLRCWYRILMMHFCSPS